jgi:hypothetical protein
MTDCFENGGAEGTSECGIRQPTDSYRLLFGCKATASLPHSKALRAFSGFQGAAAERSWNNRSE